MRVILFLLLTTFLPSLAQAGAWPREKGRVFLSLAQDITDSTHSGHNNNQALYFEYGMTETLTFGIKANKRPDGRSFDVLSFARIPIGTHDGIHKFAFELAIGGRRTLKSGHEVVLQPGLQWGRGFSANPELGAFWPGWMGLEASLGLGLSTGEAWGKLDFTLGFTSKNQNHIIVQLRGFHDSVGSSVTLAPSYVHRYSNTVKFQLGMLWQLSGNNPFGLTAATWMEF